MGPLVLNPARHRLVDTSVAEAVRDRMDDPEYGTYFHRETGNCVLFRWVSRPKGIVREYCVFRHPTALRRSELKRVLFSASHHNLKLLRDQGLAARTAKRDHNRQMEDERREHESRFNWARRKKPNVDPMILKQMVF